MLVNILIIFLLHKLMIIILHQLFNQDIILVFILLIVLKVGKLQKLLYQPVNGILNFIQFKVKKIMHL
jgi:hypothetical protein